MAEAGGFFHKLGIGLGLVKKPAEVGKLPFTNVNGLTNQEAKPIVDSPATVNNIEGKKFWAIPKYNDSLSKQTDTQATT